VPHRIDDAGRRLEHSQLIGAYLDALDGRAEISSCRGQHELACRQLEVTARSLCDGIAVWVGEINRRTTSHNSGHEINDLAQQCLVPCVERPLVGKCTSQSGRSRHVCGLRMPPT
jgi:hypothetical protein